MNSIDFPEFIIVGRSQREYAAIFALSEEELSTKRFLDIGGGVSSFLAETEGRFPNRHMAVDPLYANTVDQIRHQGFRDIETAAHQLQKHAADFCWDGHPFRSLDELKQERKQALEHFCTHFSAAPEHYLSASAKQIPLPDKCSDIVLISHLLFLYERQLGFADHLEILSEAIRLAQQEVRIFPVVDFTGKTSALLAPLRESLQQIFPVEFLIQEVDYHFMKGADAVLRIRRQPE